MTVVLVPDLKVGANSLIFSPIYYPELKLGVTKVKTTRVSTHHSD